MKVLILAYDFPPNTSVGSQRPSAWSTYLAQLGVSVTVVTRHWDSVLNTNDLIKATSEQVVRSETINGTEVVRTPFKPNLRDRLLLKHGNSKYAFLRKPLSLVQLVGQYFSLQVDNKRGIYYAARKILRKEKFDLIIATGEPFVLFKYANHLSKEFNIRWVADYRDGWSRNYNILFETTGISRWINHHFMSVLEKRLVKTASLITCTVNSHRNELFQLFPEHRIEVIYNGFFAERFGNIGSSENQEGLKIGYAGTIYSYQKLEVFIAAAINVHRLCKMEVDFFGLNFQIDQLHRLKEAYGVNGRLFHATDKMPHQDVLNELASCNALLLLATPEFHQLYAKVFDYIALGKPIIVCLNDHGPLEDILVKQPNVFLCDNQQEVEEALIAVSKLNSSDNKRLTQGELESHPYSRKTQTKRLHDLLKELIDPHN